MKNINNLRFIAIFMVSGLHTWIRMASWTLGGYWILLGANLIQV